MSEPSPAASLTSRALLANVGGTLSASVVALLAVAVANVLIARMLGVEGAGRVAAATLVPMIVGYAGELGLPVAVGYLINVEPDQRLRIIASARSLALILSVALTLVSALLVVVLPLPESAKGLALLFCAFVFVNLFHRLHLAILQADFRLRTLNCVRVIGALVYLGILVVSAVSGTGSPLRVIVALLVANLVWFVLSARLASSHPMMALDRLAVRRLLSYGARAQVGNVSSVDSLRLDQLFLALFLTTGQLGLYVAAMTVITANRVVGTSIGTVCFPLASRSQHGSSRMPARRQFRLCLGATFALSAGIAIVEVAAGGRLLGILFGRSFEPAGRALQVLAVGSVFMNLRQVIADWLRGCGRPGIVTFSELAGTVALLVVSVVLWNGSILPVAWAIAIASVAALGCLTIALALAGWRAPSATAERQAVVPDAVRGASA